MFSAGKTEEQPSSYYERNLEDGLHAYLDVVFCNDPASPYRGDDKIVANTARGGPRAGQWAQPDLMLVAIQKLTLERRVALDVFSYELKRADYGNLESVFEAFAHSRFAHYAYLVWQVPTNSVEPPTDRFKIVLSNCQAQGIGLITFTEPRIPGTYRTLLAPARKMPHPYDVELHLRRLLQEDDYSSLRMKIRAVEASLQ